MKADRLNNLKAGEKACVYALTSDEGIRRRLQDIGIVNGTKIECIGKSPLGDPTAYLIRGAVIALRSEDSSKILVNVWD